MSRHLTVTVAVNADTNRVIEKDDTLQVYTTEPAEDGRANTAVVSIIQDYLSTDGFVRIVSGHKKRQKILEISA